MAFIGNQIITLNSLLDLDGQELVLDADADTTIHVSTDDQIDFKIGGTDVMAMSTTGLTITTADNNTQLTLKSTDADSNLGPILDLLRDGGSPADSDFIGQVRFQAKDDGGNIHEYAKIFGQIADVTGGTEDGILNIRTVLNGTDTRRIDLGVTETVFNEDSADLDFRVESNGDANMLFVDAGNDRVYLGRNATDGVGNARLQIEAQDGEAGVSIHRGSASTGGGKIFFSKSRAATAGDDTVVQSGDQLGALLFTGADGTDRASAGAEISVEVDGTPGSNDMPGRITFATTADGASSVTERMRIDSSGNVFVAKSAADSTAVGVEAKALGQVIATRDGGQSGTFVRLTSDGEIVRFKKDSTTVGSIASRGSSTTSYITFPTSGAGSGIGGSTNMVIPVSETGAAQDNRIDLGSTSTRWQDLYLSGGAYIGGTGSDNKLDDYEQGTFDPFSGVSSQFAGEVTRTATYRKIGTMVAIDVRVKFTGTDNSGSAMSLQLPFTSAIASNDATAYTGSVFYEGTQLFSGASLHPHVSSGSATVILHRGDGGTFSSVPRSNVNGTYDFLISFVYFSA